MKKSHLPFFTTSAVLAFIILSLCPLPVFSQIKLGNLRLNLPKIQIGKKKDKNADNVAKDSAAASSSNQSQSNNSSFGISPSKKKEKEKSKSIPVCLSGDCQNGVGSQQSADFKYDGEFKNGEFEGKGVLVYLTGNRADDIDEGNFSHGSLNGLGKRTYAKGGWFKSQEGNFVNGVAEGFGTSIGWNDDKFTGNFHRNNPAGFGIRTKNKFPNIGYWDATDLDGTKGLTIDVLKHHLDTTFAKLVPCDCLSPSEVNIPTMGLGNVNYDVFDQNGKKLYDKHEYEVIAKTTGVNGFINNTGHNIYIKAYRKFHFNTRNVDEYFDESSVVPPGEQVLGNYRSLPESGTLLQPYFEAEIIYIGQYVDRGNAVGCKGLLRVAPKSPIKKKSRT